MAKPSFPTLPINALIGEEEQKEQKKETGWEKVEITYPLVCR